MATPRKPPPRTSGSRPQSRTAPGKAHSSARTPSTSAAKGPAKRHAGGLPGRPAAARGAAARVKARAGSRPPAAAVQPKRPAGLCPPPVLTTKQRCYLRGIGHHLAPVVQVGKEGFTEPLCTAIGVALLRHELIKLRLAEAVEGDRHVLAKQLAVRCHAALVQVLGRTLLLYRPRPDDDSEQAGEQRPHVTLH